jgi:hypothetical protein
MATRKGQQHAVDKWLQRQIKRCRHSHSDGNSIILRNSSLATKLRNPKHGQSTRLRNHRSTALVRPNFSRVNGMFDGKRCSSQANVSIHDSANRMLTLMKKVYESRNFGIARCNSKHAHNCQTTLQRNTHTRNSQYGGSVQTYESTQGAAARTVQSVLAWNVQIIVARSHHERTCNHHTHQFYNSPAVFVGALPRQADTARQNHKPQQVVNTGCRVRTM